MITFDYMCKNAECSQNLIKHEITHRRDVKQFCKECNSELHQLTCGPSSTHISWSLWRV